MPTVNNIRCLKNIDIGHIGPLHGGTVRMVCGAGSMQLSGVCLSVCLSVPFGSRVLLLRVCCRWPGGQEILIDCCTVGGWAVSSSRAAARRAAANAGSATLSADVGS